MTQAARMIRDTNHPDTTHQREPIARWVACIVGVRFTRTLGLALSLIVVASASTGCRNVSKLTGKQDKPDLLEAELRTRERELQEARSEIQYLRQLAGQPGSGLGEIPPGGYCPPGSGTGVGPAPASPTRTSKTAGGIPLRDVLLGNGTGGLDEDGRPGDEGLMVVAVPKDVDGTAVKVPGTVNVTAYEITPEGLKNLIGRWRIQPEQLRQTWKSSLLSSGYFIPLQWDKFPSTNRVRVAIRFETLDGRPYESDKDVQVKPLPGVQNRPSEPITNPIPSLELPPPSSVIPPGAKLPAPTPSPTPKTPVTPDPDLLPPPAFPTNDGEPAAILKPVIPK